MEEGDLRLKDYTFYHIQEITFEEKEPRREALENVLGAMRIPGIHFVYLIVGSHEKVNFYFGVARDASSKVHAPMAVFDIGKYVLLPSLHGNFRGSKIRLVDPENQEKKQLIATLNGMSHASYLEGVPGVSEDSDSFQGVDRLVDVMLGDEFAVVVIAKPILKEGLLQIEANLNHAYTSLVPFAKESIQDNTSKNWGTSRTKGETKSDSESVDQAKASEEVRSESKGNNQDRYKRTTAAKTTVEVTTTNSSNTSSKQASKNDTGEEGTTKSDTQGESYSRSERSTETRTKGSTTSRSDQESTNEGESQGSSRTVEFGNKEVQEWLKYLDETIFTRLDYGKGKGMFVTTTLLMTNQPGDLIKLENTLTSLYSGDTGNRVPLVHVSLSGNEAVLDQLKQFQIPVVKGLDLSDNEIHARAALSQIAYKNRAYLGNWLSTNELSLIAGLPKKEIVGLGLREEVAFGLNYNAPAFAGDSIAKAQYPKPFRDQTISLGHVVHSGNVLAHSRVAIPVENLNKHTFITGVTGSGKTTTCQKILIDSQLPFLVIEPAKTEYRILTKQYEDLLIFTLGRDTVAPFRLNPFEFFRHESISSRVDMIKASMEAAFDMEAAIPQIIEASLYACYKDYGWNISTNRNERFEDPYADGVYAFPTLSDLLAMTEKIVEVQGFDDRLKRDYIGSIKARLQGLVIGSKGLMLNTRRSIDFRDLLKRRVVLEIEEIRSAAEKALIIGFVLTNLIEAVKAEFMENKDFRHITLIEEAHRLLSKYLPGDSPNKKQSVETFTDMLAEVRKYGECLIIADQIPGKLASEVLKNTNTKIVHKIFAQDDKEAIGNTMALSDDQKNFLSNLTTGRAVVFTQDFPKAIQVQIENRTNTTSPEEISEALLRNRLIDYYRDHYMRGVFLGFEGVTQRPSADLLEAVIALNSDQGFKEDYAHITLKHQASPGFRRKFTWYLDHVGEAILVQFLKVAFYEAVPQDAGGPEANESVHSEVIGGATSLSERLNHGLSRFVEIMREDLANQEIRKLDDLLRIPC